MKSDKFSSVAGRVIKIEAPTRFTRRKRDSGGRLVWESFWSRDAFETHRNTVDRWMVRDFLSKFDTRDSVRFAASLWKLIISSAACSTSRSSNRQVSCQPASSYVKRFVSRNIEFVAGRSYLRRTVPGINSRLSPETDPSSLRVEKLVDRPRRRFRYKCLSAIDVYFYLFFFYRYSFFRSSSFLFSRYTGNTRTGFPFPARRPGNFEPSCLFRFSKFAFRRLSLNVNVTKAVSNILTFPVGEESFVLFCFIRLPCCTYRVTEVAT